MMLDRIIACWEQQSDSSHMEMAGLFDALLLRFALHVHDSEPIHKPHVHTAIPKVLTYLATHADDCRVLDHLHQRVNLSINHFRKVFKQATGMNPTQYMLMLRLRKAKYLLLTTSMNVQQIAYALGYENAQHFSRQYKQCWGMSPKQDRMSAH
jgi:transcriptional regulator GlxA family with amidase domain